MDCFNKDKTVILYHGGTDVIKKPYIKSKGNYGDFGYAFYLTDKRWQAEEWAIKAKDKRNSDKGVVNIYKLELSSDVSFKTVDVINEEWANIIALGRSGNLTGYDIIFGKMADDQIWNRCSEFLEELITTDMFIEYAKVNKDKNQYAICTIQGLENLEFLRSYEVV